MRDLRHLLLGSLSSWRQTSAAAPTVRPGEGLAQVATVPERAQGLERAAQAGKLVELVSKEGKEAMELG